MGILVRPTYCAFKLAITCGISLALISCGKERSEEITTASTACKTGQAQIQVLDGMFRHLCGCNEAVGTTAVAGGRLDCTVNRGTQIVFQMGASTGQHQIVQNGTSASAIPASDPSSKVHVISLPTAGTYRYRDAISQVEGQLIAL